MIFQTIQPQYNPGRWTRPQATINAKGEIKISRVAFELLGEPQFVTVLFDKASQTIALRRADKHDTQKHELIAHGVHGGHGGRLVKVHGLVEHIETDFFACMRFTDVHLDNNGRLILDLTKARAAYHGKRIGVYNEWRLKHDEEYAAKQRDAYHRTKENKLANETDVEREQRLEREDRKTREREYRQSQKAEREGRREREKARREQQRLAAKAAKQARDMVTIPDGTGGTVTVTKKLAADIKRLCPIWEQTQREKYGDDWKDE